MLQLEAIGTLSPVACNEMPSPFCRTAQFVLLGNTTNITLSTEIGEKNEVTSRGLDMDKGVFTTTYPFDYIYLHSADTKSVDDGHQFIEIPLKEVERWMQRYSFGGRSIG